MTSVNLVDVRHAIELALAPVFLLTGIAAMLGVMAGRLARIIDRGRHLTEHSRESSPADEDALSRALAGLEYRRHLASSAIMACTLSAFLVCMVIAALFLEALSGLELKWFIGVAFTASTLALITGLGYFLREVLLASKTVRLNLFANTRTNR
jgi:Protein of unknown function (DUF2721)